MKVLKRIQQFQQIVMGMNHRNLRLIYPNNERKNYKYADDKFLAKTIMAKHNISCTKTYAVVGQLGEIEQAWEAVSEWNELVIKPAKGAGGKGILILKRKEGKWFDGADEINEEQIFAHLANIIFGIYSFGDSDIALIEEYVRPHQFFGEIYRKGVPDFRVILLKGVPLMAMLRMPTVKSNGKANLHQGGLGIGIDLAAGKLKQAYDGRKHLNYHPDTYQPIAGKNIPQWKELVQLAIQTAAHFPLDYLGVDLVLDEAKGPMVMEVNVRPGLGIQLANRQGLQGIIRELNLMQ